MAAVKPLSDSASTAPQVVCVWSTRAQKLWCVAAFVAVAAFSLGLGLGLGLSVKKNIFYADNIYVQGSPGNGARVLQAVTNGVPASDVAIRSGTSFVGGMNLQQALDTRVAVDLNAVFTVGSKWKVKNWYPTVPFWFGSGMRLEDEVTITAGGMVSRSHAVSAFGLCSPVEVPSENFESTLTWEVVERGLLLGNSSLKCKVPGACVSQDLGNSICDVCSGSCYAWCEHVSQMITVLSVAPDRVVLIKASNHILSTAGDTGGHDQAGVGGNLCGFLTVFTPA